MNEIDRLVSSLANDAQVADDVEREVVEAGRRALRFTIEAEMRRTSRSVRWRWFRRMAIAGAIGLAIAALVAALPGIEGKNGRFGAGTASAAVVLQRAAQALDRQLWEPLQAGQYDYIRTAHGNGQSGPSSAQSTETDEAWIAADGSGRLVQHTSSGVVVIPFGSPERVRLTPQAWMMREPWTWPAGGTGIDYQQLIDLPTDTSALQRWIEARATTAGPSTDAEAFTIVGDLLRDSPAPPQLRAALFRVVARLPGVVLVGPTSDQIGRAGVAVGYVNGNERDDLIFDPASGSLLGERTVSVGSSAGAPAGTIIRWSVVEAEAIVHSDHQTPTASERTRTARRHG